MTSTDPLIFHTAWLRQRYLDSLASAVEQRRIGPQEQEWLQGAAATTTAAPVPGEFDAVRVDRLTLNDGVNQGLELAGALLLSHTLADNPQIYLYTLAGGIQAFENRHTLLGSLHTRFVESTATGIFEAEKVDGDPFEAQMRAMVEQQAYHIEQLAQQLKLTPTLDDAVTASLTWQLRRKLPHIPVDPQTHLLQIVGASQGDVDAMPVTQTLSQASFDDYRKVRIEAGFTRRFLDARGLPASPADVNLFQQALTDATSRIGVHFEDLLRTFWESTWRDRQTRRDLAIQCLSDGWRRALYRALADQRLSASTFRRLQSVADSTPLAPICRRLMIRVGYSNAYALAGTFAVEYPLGETHAWLWFSPGQGLIEFADKAALAAHLTTEQGRARIRGALALKDQHLLLQEGELRIETQAITGAVFAERVDSILSLQIKNLEYAMTLTDQPEEVSAMIDDALDVRQLLDPCQLQISAGRWRAQAPVDFKAVWGNARAEPQTLTLSASWRSLSEQFDAQAKRLQSRESVLFDCAAQALQPYVCVLFGKTVDARNVKVTLLQPATVGTEQTRVTVDLASLLLERVSGHRAAALATNVQIAIDSDPVTVDISLINELLGKLAASFVKRYVQAFKARATGRLRQGDRHVRHGQDAQGLREDAMRLDMALNKREGIITGSALNMIQQLLDRPVRGLRLALDEPATEAYSVSVAFGTHAACVLCDTMVLRQSPSPGSPWLLWQGTLGWLQFSSTGTVQQILQRELGNHPERWTPALGEREARRLRERMHSGTDKKIQIHLQRIDGHVVQALQQAVSERQQQDLQALCLRAVRCRLPADLLTAAALEDERDAQLCATLDGLAVRIDDSIFQAMLPSWLTAASVSDLVRCYQVFTRYYLATEGGKDYLFGVPLLKAFARERLIARLALDFPDQGLDPDRISVVARRQVAAIPAVGQLPSSVAAATVEQRESLVEYAISRFVAVPDAQLSIESTAQPQAVQLLTHRYLRSLVRALNIGAGYTRLLRDALAPQGADYALRKKLFIEQMPPALLAIALPEKIEGRFSAEAYDFLAHVLDVPESVAREPVKGTRVILSPLQLLADADMGADTVAGLYLICPADADSGPVILYALYHAAFVLREYASRDALMEAIRTDQDLQQLVLERVDPTVRKRYDHGGFIEPHLPFSTEGFMETPLSRPGPVTLHTTPVPGNALDYLFTGTCEMLLALGASTVVTNAQADHAVTVFLATLGMEQGLMLLPGKWAALLSLWQGHTLLRASASAASERRWGKALSEFCAALSVMAIAKEQALEDESSTQPSTQTQTAATGADRYALPLDFSWRGTALNAEQRARLQALRATGVTLKDLHRDDLLNLYVDKRDDKAYAVVEQTLYQVRCLPQEGRWIIVGADGSTGPRLALNGERQWQLDLKLRGGGGALSTIKTGAALHSAEEELVIEARGMDQIRMAYRDRATKVVNAHRQARHYLETALDNLNVRDAQGLPDTEVTKIISDFFGVDELDLTLRTRVQDVVLRMLVEVTDPSLSPDSSVRFVVGSNRPGRERMAAFVIPADPQRRVFLTEQFFRTPIYRLEPQAAAEGFDLEAHTRAATLIHELSHLVLGTKDIAYLESEAPYPNLMKTNTAARARVRTQIERLHDTRLSHRTLKEELFTVFEDGQWRDIASRDARGLATVLRITGAKTLSEARAIFLSDSDKRSQVMLMNADSVALLILRLGRTSHVQPASDEAGAVTSHSE